MDNFLRTNHFLDIILGNNRVERHTRIVIFELFFP